MKYTIVFTTVLCATAPLAQASEIAVGAPVAAIDNRAQPFLAQSSAEKTKAQQPVKHDVMSHFMHQLKALISDKQRTLEDGNTKE